MLDVAWPELIVVGAVTLVVVGPKDLPRVMHALGRMAGRVRAAVRLIGAQIDQLEAESRIASARADAPAAKKPQEQANHDEPPV